MSRRSWRFAAFALVLFSLAWAIPALAQIQKEFVFSGDELTVVDMIGKIEVGSAPGRDFTVEVRVMGSDATDDLLDFDVTEGREASLLIQFPLDEHDEYVYPALGRHGRTTISYREDQDQDESWIKRVLSGITSKRVTVRGRGDGLEVWADISIGVPDGGSLVVVDRVGEIRAKGVNGNLDLDTSSGAILAADIDGDLKADTGSGSVDARNIKGQVLIDTGSGSVVATGIEGSALSADTGSGSVELQDINAAKILVDTGSGSVRVDRADCKKLAVDTGSGGVTAREIGADRAIIDTGSGSVELTLVRMGGGRFEIDTGSGGIRLQLPPKASARISAETSSGGVTCRYSGVKIEQKSSNEMELVVGDGEAEVILDAGSGSITIE